ncbi:MAG: DUF4831 family protein [Acidobacteriota bacterium]|nr:DUF4831 family protein [Acidobacteriota bacterium]
MSLKNHLLVCAISIAAVFSIACDSEILVTKVDPTKPGSQRTDGVLFSLPETVVVADVPMTKVSSSPGIFYKWTEFFYPELTTDDFISEPKTAFKIGAPTFTTRGQTDPNNVYIAHIKSKKFETKTLLLEMTEDGIVARTEATAKDETIDIVTSSLKTAASIAAPLLHLGAGGTEANLASPKVDATFEESFKKELTAQELALYESLDDSYKDFLRNHFGYDFLLYIATKENDDGTVRSANIEFFLTLNKKQRDVIIHKPRGTLKCVEGEAGTLCLAPDVKIELVKAKLAYDKIQVLRQKRETFLGETTPPQVGNSANLEFRLKELDAQIKATEQTYFFGSPAETSATAKFEFKPSTAAPIQRLFTYAAGGRKPGICVVTESPGVFKASWPRNLKGDCHDANYLIQMGDLRDAKAFVKRLKDQAPADLVSVYLFNNFTAGLQGLLTAATGQDKPQIRERLLKRLIAELQTVVNGANIYNAALFSNVELSGSSLELLAELNSLLALPLPLSPTDAARLISIVPQLNRTLLEDAYTDELFRQGAWASREVLLSVDSSANGFAQTVATASLQEPGKRSFPFRIAAPALVRVSDAGTEKGRSELRIAQFGPVQTLPASLGGRRSSYKITYHDSTGAIKIFDMASDALIQKQNVTDLTDAATTLRDSESARLKRETELLELKKKKLDAEKALKEAQGEPSPTPSP